MVWLVLIGVAALGLFAAARVDAGVSRVPAQLRAVRGAAFTPRPILNREEFKRFTWLEVWAAGTPYRVFAQVSYGEVLASTDGAAFAAMNAKRCDMLVVDRTGMPAVAVEYQGGGHWQGDAKGRDAVKRTALASAGVPLVEVLPEHGRAEVVAMVEDALRAGRNA